MMTLNERIARLEAKVKRLEGETSIEELYLVLSNDERSLGQIYFAWGDIDNQGYRSLESLVDEFLAYEDDHEIPKQLPETIAAFERCLAKLKAWRP